MVAALKADDIPESARRWAKHCILDWIAGEVSELKRGLGSEDRARMDRYLSNIREIERRIQRIEGRIT